jgi:hypothetical protein
MLGHRPVLVSGDGETKLGGLLYKVQFGAVVAT